MLTPARILRATVDKVHPPVFSPREREQFERILAATRPIMAQRGRHRMTIKGLAQELGMGVDRLRRHFSDLEVLLATLIDRHLKEIARVIGEVPEDTADRQQQMRAAYIAHTRTSEKEYTEGHLLLVRQRQLLPNDLLPAIEASRLAIGETLAPGNAELVLDLLDALVFDGPRVEAVLAIATASADAQNTQVKASDTASFSFSSEFDMQDGEGRPTIH
jgi:AcrR family transcriptional regulator